MLQPHRKSEGLVGVTRARFVDGFLVTKCRFEYRVPAVGAFDSDVHGAPRALASFV